MINDGLQVAGEVNIEQLKLVSSSNIIADLTEFLVEFNLYEDMFNNFLQGNMVISDSRNLIEKLPIIGDEYLTVKLTTPSFSHSIEKTFRIYKVSDRVIVRDNNTQNYILHFASIELFYDILLPLYLPFEGKIHNIAGEIFENFIITNRKYDISQADDKILEDQTVTPLVMLNEIDNSVKYVSPGWSPFKNINWLCSKAIPKNETAKNFLFFESNKSFYMGSVEYIMKKCHEDNTFIGVYTPSVSNIRNNNKKDVDRELFIASDINMIETTDHIKNYTNGYLASRLFHLDILNKTYDVVDYDHTTSYFNQYHTSGQTEKALPLFLKDGLRNFASSVSYYPKNAQLFDNFSNNVSERMNEIHGNRLSSLLELTNLKLNMSIPGRTDIEVGNMFYLNYPAMGGLDNKSESNLDKNYSGWYLITALRHKINRINHTIAVEAIKDDLRVDNESEN